MILCCDSVLVIHCCDSTEVDHTGSADSCYSVKCAAPLKPCLNQFVFGSCDSGFNAFSDRSSVTFTLLHCYTAEDLLMQNRVHYC